MNGQWRPNLTGFSAASNRRLWSVIVVYAVGFAGWVIGAHTSAGLGAYIGAGVALVVASIVVFVRWWGQPVWSWAVLAWKNRRQTIDWSEPMTVANNRSGGGVRIEQQ